MAEWIGHLKGMKFLYFIHLSSVILWFGSAATDIILELTLWKAKSAEAQKAYVLLHAKIDLFLELPAMLCAVFSGALLLWSSGYWDIAVWPQWLGWKVLCGLIAAISNLFCVIFVIIRARLQRSGDLHKVARWNDAILFSVVGVPFGILALWFSLSRFF